MNIPPAPFKGGDGTVNIQEYHNCISYLYIILKLLDVKLKNN